MLHSGFAREVYNVHDGCYNLCCKTPLGAIFLGTHNTQMPLLVTSDSDVAAHFCYLGMRDVVDVCSLSGGDVVVATRYLARRYSITWDADSSSFSRDTFSKLLSVHSHQLVYAVSTTSFPKQVMRITESQECTTLIALRNPIIAVTDSHFYVSCGMAYPPRIYFAEHGSDDLRRFATLPTMVLQIMGMPNGKLAVRCSDLNVYLFVSNKAPLVFYMGTGHMVGIGEAVYCSTACLCTTTHRVYSRRAGPQYIGVCNEDMFAVAESRPSWCLE